MSQPAAETRVTAYVFGELTPDQTVAFEKELEQSSQLRDEVAAVREAVAAVTAEFAGESASVNESGRKQIVAAIGTATASSQLGGDESSSRRRMLVFATLAASLLIVCGFVYSSMREAEIQTVTEKGPIRSYDRLDKSVDPMVESKGERAERLESKLSEETSKSGEENVVAKFGENLDAKQNAAVGDNVDTWGLGRTVEDDLMAIDAPATAPGGDVPAIALGSDANQILSYRDPALVEQGSTVLERVSDERSRMESRLSAEVRASLQPSPTGESAQGSERESASALESKEKLGQELEGLELKLTDEEMRSSDGINSKSNLSTVLSKGGRAKARYVRPFGDDGASVEGEAKSNGWMEVHEMSGPGGMGAGIGGDRHEAIEDNPFMEVKNAPLSTFSVDVDTASYAKVRMYLLQQNSLPRPDAVRIEELVNYFKYDYAPPGDEHPFAATMDISECPWNPKHRLARIGIKGKVIDEDRPASNLVFLLDVSGSMDRPNKLPLVIEGMKMLTDQLTENDSVAIVVYAGAAGLVLDSTNGEEKQTIVSALERLKAGGSTNGGEGITLAYQIARDNFIVGGTNRVILCSDGDFNVGVTSDGDLVRLAEENAKGNIYLSVLGFGMGNHNDSMMENISNKGNGNYAFIDSKAEAHKVLVEEMGGTLVTIAKDVKIQVEFNPKQIGSYRLIGYENRILAAQDFNDDMKDAGEIGAGHTVTALYELVPAGVESGVSVPAVDDLRYQKKAKLSKEAESGEALTLKLRYKSPDSAVGAESTLIEFPVLDGGKGFSEMDNDFQFAASVAAFGMLLRNSPHKGDATFAAVEEIANAEGDESGYRGEFLQMVAKAKELRGE